MMRDNATWVIGAILGLALAQTGAAQSGDELIAVEETLAETVSWEVLDKLPGTDDPEAGGQE